MKQPLYKDYLIEVFRCIGVLPPSNDKGTRATAALFQTYMILAFLDSLVLTCFGVYGSLQWKINIVYFGTSVLCTMTWFAMVRTNKRREKLLHVVQTLLDTGKSHWKSNALVCLVLMFPVAYGLVMGVISVVRGDEATWYRYYFYQVDVRPPAARFAAASLKIALNHLTFPAFTNLVSVLHCRLCGCLCERVGALESRIRARPAGLFCRTEQAGVVRALSDVRRSVDLVEEVLSGPALSVFAANFAACCTCVGSMATHVRPFTTESWLEAFFLLLNPTLSLVATIWAAGEVPVVAARLRTSLCRLMEARDLMGLDTLDRGHYDKPDALLSAGKVLFFKRQLVLTVTGTILTYTFLLLNAKDCPDTE